MSKPNFTSVIYPSHMHLHVARAVGFRPMPALVREWDGDKHIVVDTRIVHANMQPS